MTAPWHVINEYDPELHGTPAGSAERIPPAAQRYMAVWLTVAIVAAPFVAWWWFR